MGKGQFLNKKKQKLKDKAIAEMLRLFDLSKYTYPNPESKLYAKHAFLFAKRNRLAIPSELKQSFCKNCFTPLFSGETARIRFSSGKSPRKIITCINCGQIKRVGFTKA